ncbi:MAG: protein kinase domain-containing protein [Phycisphaerales bacterium]
MTRVARSTSTQVEHAYGSHTDPGFAELVGHAGIGADGDLADLIEADGRARVRQGLDVTLSRYLDAVADLPARVEALDAAIDVTLRRMTARGDSAEQAAERLVALHPGLAAAIREAAVLSRAVLSTSSLRRALIRPAPARVVPSGFGPQLADGRYRYELTTLLGRGSAGEVYKAIDRLMSETAHEAVVAVKLLADRAEGSWSRQRFVDEATKARRVVHPNVVRVIDRGTSDRGEDFIVYEYVPGGDMGAYAGARPAMPQDEVVRLVAGVARGIEAAHAAGLVHCDLKPSNVVIAHDGEARIADFGVAVRSRAWEEHEPEARDRGPVGNLAFIAPEQYRMEPGALAPAADIYAIGGMLYWLFTRRLPNGESAEEIELVHHDAHGRTRAPSIRELRPDADPQLDAVCRRCLAPRPSSRYGSAAQLADDLEAWLRHEPIRWTRPPLARRLRLWVRRSPALAAVIAVLILVVVGAGIGGWRVLAVARRQEHEASVAAGELAGNKRFQSEALKQFELMYKFASAGSSSGDVWQLLPIMPYMEWAFQSLNPVDGAGVQYPWELDRVRAIRQLLARSRAEAGDADPHTLALEFTLAYHLVRDGPLDEGAELARANRAAWALIVPAGTRWLVWLDGVIAAADVQRLAANPRSPDRAALLARAEPALLAAWFKLAHGPTETPLKKLIGRTLVKLYGPDLLDQPQRAAPFQP